MGGKDDANGLPPNLRCDAAADRVLRYQPNRPPGSAFRRGSAHHRNDSRTLRTVEGRLGLPAWLVGQRGPQTTGNVALPDTRHFPRERPHGLCRRSHRRLLVEEFEHPNAAPRTGRQLALALHRNELGAVLLGQLQAREALWGIHPLLRSEVDPGIKPNVITKRRSKD